MTTKRIALFLLSATAVVLFLMTSSANAEETHLTPNQAEYISSVCKTIEPSLTQLHSNDALLRVNVGQNYESIGTRLLNRFSARVQFNNLNNSNLVTANDEYDKSLVLFRNAYRDYEVSLSELIALDCQKEPTRFFNTLENTRSKRQAVRQQVEAVNAQLQIFMDTVNQFEEGYRTVAGQNGS